MRHLISCFDDFMPEPEAVRELVLSGKFETVSNSHDNLSYPGINKDIPSSISEFLLTRLTDISGARVLPQALFARATHSSVHPAHNYVHSDRIMAEYSAHLYLSTEWPEGAGTTFWAHESEGQFHKKESDQEFLTREVQRREPWTCCLHIQGKFNRLLIHDARLWHRAEPFGGWGDSPKNGRLVLTCFFNLDLREEN